MRTRTTGFTLIELMVTILVLSILVAISVPLYTNQVRESRRTEAKTALLDIAAREERYFSTNSAYTNSPTNLGYAGANWPVTVGSGYYTVTVCVASAAPCGTSTATTGSVFLLTANTTGAQLKDTNCAAFTLDNTGAQSATNTNCW